MTESRSTIYDIRVELVNFYTMDAVVKVKTHSNNTAHN